VTWARRSSPGVSGEPLGRRVVNFTTLLPTISDLPEQHGELQTATATTFRPLGRFRVRPEIDENLQRADLTPAERKQHLAERARIVVAERERAAGEVLRQSDAKPPPKRKPHRSTPVEHHKPSGRPAGGVRAAAREMGVPEVTVRRALAPTPVFVAPLAEDPQAAIQRGANRIMVAYRQESPASQELAYKRISIEITGRASF